MDFIKDAISVVIPTYNRAHLIKESIQSVLDQTLQPYEIIIVDDFSTDNTEEIVNSFNSPLIKFVKNQRKKGANGARNTGILKAKGAYIAFHDSDDIWLPEKLFFQKKVLIELPEIGLCFCTIRKNDGHGISPIKKIDKNEIKNKIKNYNFISTQTILMKSVLAKEILFDENLKRFQDWDFVLRYLERFKAEHVNQVLVEQNINEDSITNKVNYFEAYQDFYLKHPEIANIGINNNLVKQQLIFLIKPNFILKGKIFILRCLRYVFYKLKRD